MEKYKLSIAWGWSVKNSSITQARKSLEESIRSVDKTTPSIEELRQEPFKKWKSFVNSLKSNWLNRNKKNFLIVGTWWTFQSNQTENWIAPDGWTLKDCIDAINIPLEDWVKNIHIHDLINLDSSQMELNHWKFLAECLDYLEKEASWYYDWIIVTHGTDTMAYWASLITYMLSGFPKPIIFTWSQKPARIEWSDAGPQMNRAIKWLQLLSANNCPLTVICCWVAGINSFFSKKAWDHIENAFQSYADDYLTPPVLEWSLSQEINQYYIRYRKNHASMYKPFFDLKEDCFISEIPSFEIWTNELISIISNTRIGLIKTLWSATCRDDIAKIIVEATEAWVLSPVIVPPFADATIEPGTYEAWAILWKTIERVQWSIPSIIMSPDAIRAKMIFAANYTKINEKIYKKELFEWYQIRNFFNCILSNIASQPEFPFGRDK